MTLLFNSGYAQYFHYLLKLLHFKSNKDPLNVNNTLLYWLEIKIKLLSKVAILGNRLHMVVVVGLQDVYQLKIFEISSFSKIFIWIVCFRNCVDQSYVTNLIQ